MSTNFIFVGLMRQIEGIGKYICSYQDKQRGEEGEGENEGGEKGCRAGEGAGRGGGETEGEKDGGAC